MALREFTASDGRGWHVWDITPEKMHPSTRAEDYLQNVLEGWLVFEASDGTAKARLYPIPSTWETATEDQLRSMLQSAVAVKELSDRRVSVRAPVAEGMDGESRKVTVQWADREVARSGNPSMHVCTFRYPGGRVWSVAERSVQTPGSEPHLVLRFSSGSRVLDLEGFPQDWVNYSDEQLVDLLCIAFPRPTDHDLGDGVPNRRRGDTSRG